MPVLKNIRHERFAQNVVSGQSLAAAYVAAGYKKTGASANSARLVTTESVSSRVAELRNQIEEDFINFQITERNERLKAAQERWDGMREVIQARKAGDWSRALKTGLVVRKERVIGSGKNAKLVEEYEVDTGLLNTMAALEKQVAIETGQWTERQEVGVLAEVRRKAVTLAEVFSLEELVEMQRRLAEAAKRREQPLAELGVPEAPRAATAGEREQQAKPEETSSGKLLSAPAEFRCAEAARNEPAADESVHPEVISHTMAPRNWRE